MNRGVLTAVLGAGILVVLIAGLRLGAVSLSTTEVVEGLLGFGDPTHTIIVRDLRLPRMLLAFLIGGGLAVAGAVFQAILRNPLAEPYILGVSGGAATGAVLVLATGIMTAGSWLLPGAAFLGALLAIVLVFGVASSAHKRVDVRVLLLAGVVVGAFFGACISFILAISDAPTVRSAILWMMGSLAGARWENVSIVAVYTLPAVLALVALARPLNALSLGEESAAHLGVEVEGVKRVAYIVASLLTAAGVAVAGVIGFVGLVVPHSIRLLVGPEHRTLLPLSFAAGACFLALADLLARTLMAPGEIPVGVVTAFVGVPFFLVLLRTRMAG